MLIETSCNRKFCKPHLRILVMFWIFDLCILLLVVSGFQGPQTSKLVVELTSRISCRLASVGFSRRFLESNLDKLCGGPWTSWSAAPHSWSTQFFLPIPSRRPKTLPNHRRHWTSTIILFVWARVKLCNILSTNPWRPRLTCVSGIAMQRAFAPSMRDLTIEIYWAVSCKLMHICLKRVGAFYFVPVCFMFYMSLLI